MEPAEKPMKFVVYTEIEEAHETAFLPKGMNEFFFCKGHSFKAGDQVKVTIQKWKWPDVRPDHDSQD